MNLETELKRLIADAVREAMRGTPSVPRLALTIAEAGQSLGRSERTVRRLIESGELHARKAGPNGHLMVPVAALDAWLMDGATVPSTR